MGLVRVHRAGGRFGVAAGTLVPEPDCRCGRTTRRLPSGGRTSHGRATPSANTCNGNDAADPQEPGALVRRVRGAVDRRDAADRVADEPELRWAPLLWLPVVIGFSVLSGMSLQRILRQMEHLDDEQDGLKDAYDRARLDALNDRLTGLGNHRAFEEELDLQVARVRAESGSIALLYVDLDDLQADERGPGARRGRRAPPGHGQDHPGHHPPRRTAGSGSAVTSSKSSWCTLRPDEAVTLARRILASALSGGSGTLGVAPFSLTIGVSAMPALARDRRQLNHQADAALYSGETSGRTDVQLFDPARHGIADDGRALPELAAAVARVSANRLLAPVYQPIHCLRTGRILGYEGLVRPNEDSGFANASALFVAAESTDHTVELDLASLDTVLTGARQLDANLYLSVNLSPRSLESDDFQPQEFLALIRRRGIDPGTDRAGAHRARGRRGSRPPPPRHRDASRTRCAHRGR